MVERRSAAALKKELPMAGRKAAFNALDKHRKRLADLTMREMFAADSKRFESFSASFGDMLLDYSKNRIDAATMKSRFDLARAAEVEPRRDRMWAGEHINTSEDRAELHMALRDQGGHQVMVDGHDVMPDVRAVLDRMKAFSAQVRAGSLS